MGRNHLYYLGSTNRNLNKNSLFLFSQNDSTAFFLLCHLQKKCLWGKQKGNTPLLMKLNKKKARRQQIFLSHSVRQPVILWSEGSVLRWRLAKSLLWETLQMPSAAEGWLPVPIASNDKRRIRKHPRRGSGLEDVPCLVLHGSRSTKFKAACDHFIKTAVFLWFQMTHKQVLRFALYCFTNMESSEQHFPAHFQFRSNTGHKRLPRWLSSSRAGDKELNSLDWTDSSMWRCNSSQGPQITFTSMPMLELF